MRVAGIEMHDHPALGNLAIDFRNEVGHAPATIILAGENGCGKTAILETIYHALGPWPSVTRRPSPTFRATVFVEPHPAIQNALQNHHYLAGPYPPNAAWSNFAGFGIRLYHPVPGNEDEVSERQIWSPRTGELLYDPPRINAVLTNTGCFLSEANTTFEVPVIQTATGKITRPEGHEFQGWMRGGSQLAQQIAQLIVDLRMADSNDAADWLRNNEEGRPPPEVSDRRIGPLAKAFGRLFERKVFAGIDTSAGAITPMFEERGVRIPLSKLSTGEKQVIFRGGFLLREPEALRNGVVLIDEPELSLHPTWQSKILPFYEAILSATDETHNQIIIATHSPFVVHGSPKAKHVILKRNATGRVIEDPAPSYPGVTSGDVAIAAFDLSSSVFSRPGNRMVVVTEGRTDAEILRIAWTHLRPGQAMPFNLMSAGGAKSVRAFLGAEADTTGPLMDALGDAHIDRFLALFDFDREGYEQWNGMITRTKAEAEDLAAACPHRKRRGARVWAALLPVPRFRPGYAGFGPGLESRSRLTIELLFEDANVGRFLIGEPVPAAPGAVVLVAPDSQKSAIAEAAANFPPSAFAAFEPVFQLIDAVLTAP